ncbi:hypothetical protein SUGI_0858120 [Cryptomeria japonica]|nr:hypothetical protein SUGI_0858120 [Cryptomeria japonica]
MQIRGQGTVNQEKEDLRGASKVGTTNREQAGQGIVNREKEDSRGAGRAGHRESQLHLGESQAGTAL